MVQRGKGDPAPGSGLPRNLPSRTGALRLEKAPIRQRDPGQRRRRSREDPRLAAKAEILAADRLSAVNRTRGHRGAVSACALGELERPAQGSRGPSGSPRTNAPLGARERRGAPASNGVLPNSANLQRLPTPSNGQLPGPRRSVAQGLVVEPRPEHKSQLRAVPNDPRTRRAQEGPSLASSGSAVKAEELMLTWAGATDHAMVKPRHKTQPAGRRLRRGSPYSSSGRNSSPLGQSSAAPAWGSSPPRLRSRPGLTRNPGRPPISQ